MTADNSRLGAEERLRLLCDPGSLQFLRSEVASRRLRDRHQAGDGVVAAAGRIQGRPVFCYAQDRSFLGGSLGEAHGDTIVRVLELAGEVKLPVIGFVESAGARMQEGVAALASYARIFRQHVALSGQVPQISVVSGMCAGGGSYSPALTDFVVMPKDASMFLTGPAVVGEVMREKVTAEELGGVGVHQRNGVCQLVASDERAAIGEVHRLFSFLPQNSSELPPPAQVVPPAGEAPGDVVPAEQRRIYDVRDVIRRIVDGGELLEISPRWAGNMFTGLARIHGRAVGVVANQPRHLGATIDVEASQKAAQFVTTCERMRLPLVVLVDTPGFLPGTTQEALGVIRHGASLVRAFAAATVPRVTVILRKAYGGAYITMNSRDLGAHLTFAWPNAEIGVMGASQAVKVIKRRELAHADDPARILDQLAEAYAEEHLRAAVAVADGFVDEVIAPDETRARLAGALDALASRRRRLTDNHDGFRNGNAGTSPLTSTASR